MSFIELIKTRRSIRSFKNDDILNGMLETIVDAARHAPSAGNIQPWLFIIIKDVKIKREIHTILGDRMLRYLKSPEGRKNMEKYGKDLFSKYVEVVKAGQFQKHVIEAPVLIAVFGNTESPYYIHDCCAAIENLILAAHSLGLGSCWIDPGIGDKTAENQIQELLKVPENFRIVSFVALGFPAETPKQPPKKEIHEIVFLDKYGKPFISRRPNQRI